MSKPPRILTHVPSPLLDRVRQIHPDVEIMQIPDSGEIEASLGGEILLTYANGTANLADAMSRGIRWVHAYGTGVDAFPFELLGDAVFSCSRGASAPAISEWVIAVMLAAEKRLPESWIHEPPERWNISDLGTLADRNLALIGFGGIAQAIARRALPFDMKVKALRRTQAASPIPEVEIVTSLEALLGDADHVVVAAPETPATRHLLDAKAFSLLRPGAHLVNIARGGLVDQEALREALARDLVRLASLDCVEPEPLPAGHWLFEHPQVRLSPHISWSAPGAFDGMIEPFVENLARFREDAPLDYTVDLDERY